MQRQIAERVSSKDELRMNNYMALRFWLTYQSELLDAHDIDAKLVLAANFQAIYKLGIDMGLEEPYYDYFQTN